MNDLQTIHEVIEVYLEHAPSEMNDHSFDTRQRILRKFDAECGHLKIADARPFDLQTWISNHPEYKSPSTVASIIIGVRRAFNFCLEMELITRDPFARMKKPKGNRRRPLIDQEYQALLRASPALFRRFLIFLAFTGCRPGEASMMTWGDVHFDKGCVILRSHKTSRKTGKPRVIPLVDTTTKLLLWLKNHRQVSTVELVERLLNDGPMRVTEFAQRLRAYGISHTAAKRARTLMGVEKRRERFHYFNRYVERWMYVLPKDYVSRQDPYRFEFPFINSKGNPWTRHALAIAHRRVRRRAGLPDDAKLYCLRHRYGLRGIVNGVNLKLLSLAMGHSSTVMTEHYIAEAGLTDEVQKAASQVAYGPGAVPVPPQPVKEVEPVTEHLPGRYAVGKDRPHVEPKAPSIQNGSQTDYLLQQVLKQLIDKPEGVRPTHKSNGQPEKLFPCQERCFQAWRWAIAQRPELAEAPGREVFEFLQSVSYPGRLPPLWETFCRNLAAARAFYRAVRPNVSTRVKLLGYDPPTKGD